MYLCNSAVCSSRGRRRVNNLNIITTSDQLMKISETASGLWRTCISALCHFCGAAGEAWAHSNTGICFCFFKWLPVHIYMCVCVCVCVCVSVMRKSTQHVNQCKLEDVDCWRDVPRRNTEAVEVTRGEREKGETGGLIKGKRGFDIQKENKTQRSAREMFKFVTSHFVNMPPSVKFQKRGWAVIWPFTHIV